MNMKNVLLLFPLSLHRPVLGPHYSTDGKLHPWNTSHCEKLDNTGGHSKHAAAQVPRSL